MKKKLVFLTGSGMSAESGIPTFRDTGGLWEEYPVELVASAHGFWSDPNFVNEFYNKLRKKFQRCKPNDGHKLVAELEKDYEVVVITQNVDNLHEQAGSTNVIHLHGELMKVCSSKNVNDEKYHRVLDFDEEVKPDEKTEDGGILRPFIVFFGEDVPNIGIAANEIETADIVVVIGTSLQVYPAAGLLEFVKNGVPIYLIDPNLETQMNVTHIKKGACEGMKELYETLTSNL